MQCIVAVIILLYTLSYILCYNDGGVGGGVSW